VETIPEDGRGLKRHASFSELTSKNTINLLRCRSLFQDIIIVTAYTITIVYYLLSATSTTADFPNRCSLHKQVPQDGGTATISK